MNVLFDLFCHLINRLSKLLHLRESPVYLLNKDNKFRIYYTAKKTDTKALFVPNCVKNLANVANV